MPAIAVCGNWKEFRTDEGKPYYFNKQTKVTTWTKPAEWDDAAAVPVAPKAGAAATPAAAAAGGAAGGATTTADTGAVGAALASPTSTPRVNEPDPVDATPATTTAPAFEAPSVEPVPVVVAATPTPTPTPTPIPTPAAAVVAPTPVVAATTTTTTTPANSQPATPLSPRLLPQPGRSATAAAPTAATAPSAARSSPPVIGSGGGAVPPSRGLAPAARLPTGAAGRSTPSLNTAPAATAASPPTPTTAPMERANSMQAVERPARAAVPPTTALRSSATPPVIPAGQKFQTATGTPGSPARRGPSRFGQRLAAMDSRIGMLTSKQDATTYKLHKALEKIQAR